MRQSTSSWVVASLILSFMLGIGIVLALFGPIHIFRQASPIKLAILNDRSEYGRRIRLAGLKAIEDINQSIQGMTGIAPNPPEIEIIPESDGDMSEYVLTQINAGVTHFLTDSHQSVSPFVAKFCPRCVMYSLAPNFIANQSGISVNFGLEPTARAYASLINQTNPSRKNVFIIPVLRQEVGATNFLEAFVQVIQTYPNIKLTSPVIYQASQYPQSDALQVISDIGSRLGLAPRAQIFLISTQDLPLMIRTSEMNKALGKRRWFAMDLFQVEDQIRSNEKASKFCEQVSLTTLTYLADGTSNWHIQLRKNAVETTPRPLGLSLFQEALAYETVMLLHRVHTRALALNNLREEEFISDEGPYDRVSRARISGLMISHVYQHGSGVQMVPRTKWVLAHQINVTHNRVEIVPIRSQPLHRDELQRIQSMNQCQEALAIHVELEPSILIPSGTLDLASSEMPSTLIIPSDGAIRVDYSCSDATPFSYQCLPAKFDSGNLTCFSTQVPSFSSSVPHSKEPRVPRAVVGKKFQTTLDVWKSLLPNVISCSSSVAGCDFCMYFLATYDISSSPAACVAGCSLGTFGSCSTVVTTSFIKTMGWD